jgi:hypothetical protein
MYPLGMRWVNCLKTLNKLTMCLPGKTPSAPSVYRWMFNWSRSRIGCSGEGASSNLNLTGGKPKKLAPLQAYVKYYWDAKVKQEVINAWAPTPETDLFGETDIGEDQVAWGSVDSDGKKHTVVVPDEDRAEAFRGRVRRGQGEG